MYKLFLKAECRYRNRMEFKGHTNRIRIQLVGIVDIETEWNLKHNFTGQMVEDLGRYRNRMEFKGFVRRYTDTGLCVDIETEWNLKFTRVREQAATER